LTNYSEDERGAFGMVKRGVDVFGRVKAPKSRCSEVVLKTALKKMQ